MPRKTSKDLTGTNRILFVKEHRNLIVSEQLIISLKALITRAISENILVIHPNAEAVGLSGQGIVMGRNPAFPILAAMVGITQEFITTHSLGRIRDAWIEPDGKTICILHRNYGEDGKEANDNAKLLPTYRAYHSASDETYAWWEFGVPEGLEELAKQAVQKTDTRNCWERYLEVIDKMGKGVNDDDTAKALEAGKKVVAGLNYALKEGVAEVNHGKGSVVIKEVKPIEETKPKKGKKMAKWTTKWTTKWPTKPGKYWFFGWPYGRSSDIADEHLPPELRFVEVREELNTVIVIAGGHFWYENEGGVGLFSEVDLPEMPENEVEKLRKGKKNE
jgi:hypothetical protein